ncbi:MAG: SCO family protein [Chloroflexi bacterium]|nr:SCO family protein [Chloroflexota bacterium]
MGVRRGPWPSAGAMLFIALLVATVAAALVVAAPMAASLRSRGQATTFRGAVAEPPVPVPSIALTNERGQTARLTDYRGQVVVLYFGYTSCPDVCPLTLQTIARARQALGRDGEQVRVLLITVDPERDTPERLASYLRLVDPTFGGLTGGADALGEMYAAFGVRAEKEPTRAGAAGYTVAHSSVTFVVDRIGRVRLAYPVDLQPDDVAADLRILLREKVS